MFFFVFFKVNVQEITSQEICAIWKFKNLFYGPISHVLIVVLIIPQRLKIYLGCTYRLNKIRQTPVLWVYPVSCSLTAEDEEQVSCDHVSKKQVNR